MRAASTAETQIGGPSMSRHRDAVFALAESVAQAAKRALSDDAVRRLVEAGETPARVEPFAPEQLTDDNLAKLKKEVENLIGSAAVEEFRDAEVVIHMTPRERVSRCVAGAQLMARLFTIVDVRVTAAVRTRWVYPRPQVAFARQWVVA